MSTSLLAAEAALSKEIGDFWSSTTTGDGLAGGTTLVDAALKAKANDWITDEAYDMLTEEPASAAVIYEERKISSLSNSLGTLTVLAHGGQIETGINYRIHRLFEASEKRRAILFAIKNCFPSLFTEIWDETLVSGNWLKDSSFERWTDATDPTDWTATTVTATQTSTAGYYRHGAYSCKLSGTAGTLVQQWKAGTSEFDDLKNLRGRTVTFTIQAWCDTADSLKISIYDGTTRTSSSYHDGDSAWTEDEPRNDDMYAQQYIAPNATEVTFTIHYSSGTAYVDDARAIADYRGRLYIGHLGLVKNRPHQVFIEPTDYSQEEDWIKLFDYKVDQSGYLYIPTTYPSDYRLRIRGIKYLDFVDSDGASGTDWEDTIEIDDPELKIITAEAAYYLYTWMSMPNYETGTRKDFQEAIAFWAMEKERRKSQYGMRAPATTIHWGVH